MAKLGKRYSLLHSFIIIYMIAAFSWWAILLYKKNKENYTLQKQLESYGVIAQEDIHDKYLKQRNMILSEGIFFGISILLGLLLINRAFRKELQMNQKQNDFLLSVTHELKTPISSLKLVNETLKRKNLSDDKRADLLDTGWEESLRLESLVNNILTAAQIEQEYQFNFEKTDINALVENRVARFRKLYPLRTIIFSSDKELFVNVDKEAFDKVIDNLIHNAIKYSPQQKPVELLTKSTSEDFLISIGDVGPGIPISEREKIWDKFYRVGNEETRDSQGTGLGLWIARQIIIAHKGKISYSENKPQGSIFNISFPSIA